MPNNDAKSPPTDRPILKRGSKGDAVKELQTLINNHYGNVLAVDGHFGSHTQSLVIWFQAQHSLTADGEVGPATWEALLKDPSPPAEHFVSRLLTEARSHVNYNEGPGRNENMFSKYFGRPAEPWCADFVSYCSTKAGKPLNEASVDRLLGQFKRQRKFHTDNPKPGDVIIFDAVRGDADPSNHTGIVESVSPTQVETIEGNSGDGVRRRDYNRNDPYIVGYGTL